MMFRTYKPGSPLSDFVVLLWLYEGYHQPHAKERILPDGSMELVINLRDDVFRVYDRHNHNQFTTVPGYLLCGPQSEFVVIDTAQQASIMGVHFKPGGAFPFLKLSADELHNEMVSLDLLWGSAAADLRDQTVEA